MAVLPVAAPDSPRAEASTAVQTASEPATILPEQTGF